MVPTLLGFVVVQLLERHFPDFVDAGFTSRMEAALDEIAQGKVDRAAYLDDYYRGLTSAIDLVSDAIDRKSAKRVLLRWVRGVGDGFWSWALVVCGSFNPTTTPPTIITHNTNHDNTARCTTRSAGSSSARTAPTSGTSCRVRHVYIHI